MPISAAPRRGAQAQQPRKVIWLGPAEGEASAVPGAKIIPASVQELSHVLAAWRARFGGRPVALDAAVSRTRTRNDNDPALITGGCPAARDDRVLEPGEVDGYVGRFGWHLLEQAGPEFFTERYITPAGRNLTASQIEWTAYAERR